MAYILTFVIACGASTLTFFSGFGLGTILLPLFLAFFEPKLAIPAAALVHFANSIFKFTFVFKHIHLKILIRFGIPAVITAYLGSMILDYMNTDYVLLVYHFGDVFFAITPLKLVIGIMIVTFAGIESSKRIKEHQFKKNYLVVGGALSGFFGGLSGHQGALRSLFLKNTDLTKEQLVSTSTSISLGIDLIRIIGYLQMISISTLVSDKQSPILLFAVIGSFLGVMLGNRLLKKATLEMVHKIISKLLILFGILMILGIV